MKFAIDGTEYDFDLDSLTFDEAEAVEEFTGYDVVEFGEAVQTSKVKAMRAMVYLAKRRNGEDVEWADLGSVDVMELALSIIELNDIDIEKAANGQNPQAIAALAEQIKKRQAAGGNRAQRRTK